MPTEPKDSQELPRRRLPLTGAPALLIGVMFLATACADFFIPSNPFADDEEEPTEERAEEESPPANGDEEEVGEREGDSANGEANGEATGEEEDLTEAGGAEETAGRETASQSGSATREAEAPELEEAFLSTEDAGDPVEALSEVPGTEEENGGLLGFFGSGDAETGESATGEEGGSAAGDAEGDAAGDAEVALGTRVDEVFAVGRTASLPDDTEFGIEWEALEVYDPEEEYGYETGILDSESDDASGSEPFSFSLEEAVGSDPLPPGSYEAALTVDGRVVERLPFSLYEPQPTVVARPGSDLGGEPAEGSSVTSEPTDLQFVVDGSASMTELVGEGVPKIDAAKEAMQPLISALPEGGDAENINVGLRAYGQNRTDDIQASCEDTELLSPMSGVDKDELRSEVEALEALGRKTPLAYTVEQAAQDFSADNENNAIILVSDGMENCQPEAVDAVSEAAEEANLTVHVVGFDLGAEAEPEAARDELQSIAEATGGVYVDTESPEELAEALRQIAEEEVGVVQVRSGAGQLVLKTPDDIPPDSFNEFLLLDEEGSEVVQEYGYSRDQRTNTYQLPAGTYTGVFYPASGLDPLTVGVEIGPSQESVFETGALRLRAPEDTDTVSLVDRQTGRANEGRGFSNDNYLDRPLAVPPGSYDLFLQATNLSDPVLVAEEVEVEAESVVEVTP